MTEESTTVTFRRFADDDSVEQLTEFLHRAYADHAAAGRVFFASYQSVQDTTGRLRKGECWVAVDGGVIVGTVTVSAADRRPAGYPAGAEAGAFWQLAVEPALRGTGLGQRLLELAERRIAELGTTRIVIDTSSQADELLGWYRRRGYAPVGSFDWSTTNYLSTVLAKDLQPA